MKKFIAAAVIASTAICSTAYAQNSVPKKSQTIKVDGGEGHAGDSVMQLSFGGAMNFVPEYGDGGLRFYMDLLVGAKLNSSSNWTVALVFGASSDLNDGGIFVKPDIGVLFRNRVFFIDMTLGPDWLHGFQCCDQNYFGYHVALQPGIRIGAFQIGIPMSADNVEGMSVYSIGADLGIQL